MLECVEPLDWSVELTEVVLRQRERAGVVEQTVDEVDGQVELRHHLGEIDADDLFPQPKASRERSTTPEPDLLPEAVLRESPGRKEYAGDDRRHVVCGPDSETMHCPITDREVRLRR